MKTRKLNFFALLFIAALFITGCSTSDDAPETLSFEIGQEHQGGIIFYLDNTQQHGLIAYPSDLPEGPWGCLDTHTNPPNYEDLPTSPIARNDGIGFGLQNTLAIIDYCDEPNIAARLAYNVTGYGYDDWYLPSIEELRLIYEHRELIGGFPDLGDDSGYHGMFIYASSSEGNPIDDGTGGFYYLNCKVFDFSDRPAFENNRSLLTGKDNAHIVRPIRSF